MGAIGGFLRAVVLALLIGAVSGLIGALIAVFFCAGGACEAAIPAADLITEPTPGLGGAVSTAALLAVLLFLGLVIVFVPRDPVISLGTIFALLVAILGFLLWLPRPSKFQAAEPAADEPLPAVADEPEVTDPLPLQCEPGTFENDGACVPCEEPLTAPAAPKVSFTPINTGASFTYARSAMVDVAGVSQSVRSFVATISDEHSICDAEAVLVFGSASSDGLRERNEKRAKDRAENLGAAVKSVCGEGVDVYPVSLGQSEAEVDTPEDRAVTIVKLGQSAPEGITTGTVLEELSYHLSAGSVAVSLLGRGELFPQPWTGPGGEPTEVAAKSRPLATTMVPVPGAPPSCRSPQSDLRLDAAPTLPQ